MGETCCDSWDVDEEQEGVLALRDLGVSPLKHDLGEQDGELFSTTKQRSYIQFRVISAVTSCQRAILSCYATTFPWPRSLAPHVSVRRPQHGSRRGVTSPCVRDSRSTPHSFVTKYLTPHFGWETGKNLMGVMWSCGSTRRGRLASVGCWLTCCFASSFIHFNTLYIKIFYF